MRIAIDAMGGDYAPDEIVAGAVEAARQLDKDDELLLVGPQELIQAKLSGLGFRNGPVTAVDAPDVIGMDNRRSACTNRRFHCRHGQAGQKEHQYDAVISGEHRGLRGRVPDADADAARVPWSFHERWSRHDATSALARRQPISLCQYGLMSSIYAEVDLGINNPRR